MGLPWVRVDTNIHAHDKILALKSDPSPKKWQAISSYFFSIAWCGGTGTDGEIPAYALETIHGTTSTARLLVKYGLWTERTAGWKVVNFEQRQELSIVAEAKRAAQAAGARKGNCVRHHGPNCGCWRESA